MVRNITSLTGNGLKDWLWQRVSAVILGGYAIFLLGYFYTHPGLTYVDWTHLFQCFAVKLFSLLALFSLVAHAWVGLWTVSTDYIKCACVRVFLQVGLILFLLSLLVWGIDIFWSV